jgi:hypothetical protein
MALTKTWIAKAGQSIKAPASWIAHDSVSEAMAILSADVSFDAAYIAVEDVAGTKQSVSVKVGVFTSSDKKSRLAKAEFVFTPNMAGKNFIAQAYDYLKTLPEFSGASDC